MVIIVKIKFLGVGYNDFYQASVIIYDKKMNKVFEGETYNGIIKVHLRKNEIYIIKATFNGQTFCSPLIFKNTNIQVIPFFSIQNEERLNTVTFLLTDYWYNLPIERGEIMLWQR